MKPRAPRDLERKRLAVAVKPTVQAIVAVTVAVRAAVKMTWPQIGSFEST